MSEQEKREAWVGKHTQQMFSYCARCSICEAEWTFYSATKNPEIHCPFCDNEEPITTRED